MTALLADISAIKNANCNVAVLSMVNPLRHKATTPRYTHQMS